MRDALLDVPNTGLWENAGDDVRVFDGLCGFFLSTGVLFGYGLFFSFAAFRLTHLSLKIHSALKQFPKSDRK